MNELSEEALVAASVDVVWADLTLAPLLAEWLWPPRFGAVAVIDPVVLGAWEVRSESAGMAVLGEIVEISPPDSLRVRWRWEGEEHATDVSISLEAAADRSTRVIVRQSGFLTDEERASHIEGWSNCLQRLVERHA